MLKTIINANNKLISETEQIQCDTMLRSILVFQFVIHIFSKFHSKFSSVRNIQYTRSSLIKSRYVVFSITGAKLFKNSYVKK